MASSAAPFLPSFSSSPPPPPASFAASSPAAEAAAAAASPSPSAACLLPAPRRTRARSRSGFLGLAMSGGAARLPPPLHGPSLPESGARSQGRGSPAGHGAPRAALGPRGPPPGERERGPGRREVALGVPHLPDTGAGPEGLEVVLRSAWSRGRPGDPSLGGGWGAGQRRNSRRSQQSEGSRGDCRQVVCRPASRGVPGAPCVSVAGAAMLFSPPVGMQRCEARPACGAGAGDVVVPLQRVPALHPRLSAAGAARRIALLHCASVAVVAAIHARLWCALGSAGAWPALPAHPPPCSGRRPCSLLSGSAGRPLCCAPERFGRGGGGGGGGVQVRVRIPESGAAPRSGLRL